MLNIDFSKLLDEVMSLVTQYGMKIIGAILVLIIGMKLIGMIVKKMNKSKAFEKLDPNLQSFFKSFVKSGLYILLIISLAVILGIPTASFVTVLASAGVAIGLALQGALSNFAGGIVLLIFRQFKVGDCIQIGANTGVVKDINVFYTVLVTPDNKAITLPNGSITNTSVTNFSSLGTRRAELAYTVSAESDGAKVKNILLYAAKNCEKVLDAPSAPTVALTAHNATADTYTLLAWCNQEDYGAVTGGINEAVAELFAKEGSGVDKFSFGTVGAL
jgi:small conductance mechanosensitive channel